MGPKLPSDSREKILQAAFAVLSREGYENTSIHDIAEEAGVAQGLVHYYFKSKQKLVLAVLFEVCQKMNVYTAEGTAGALAAFENFKVLLHSQPDAHSLYIQLIGVGLHDQEIGAGIRDNIRSERGHVEDLARQVLAERETDPSPGRSACTGRRSASTSRRGCRCRCLAPARPPERPRAPPQAPGDPRSACT